MVRVLLPSTPVYGHVMPMITIGRGLTRLGHHVTLLSGRKYAETARQAGLDFVPLPADIDFDDADLDGFLPDRHRHKGIAALRHDVIGVFVRTIPSQHAAVTALMASGDYDVVLAESNFAGIVPTLLNLPRDRRIPVFAVCPTPLSVTSVDCAPTGIGLAPGHTALSRLRNRALNALIHGGPLKAVDTAAAEVLERMGSAPLPGNVFDHVTLFDLAFHLAPAGFEYPRRELPDTVRFVGPLPLQSSADTPLPDWWSDLDGARPVVHVTQGTIDNADPGRLIVPTIRALAGEDVLVVASTGGKPVADVLEQLGGTLPENARVAEFLPYDRLLPKTAVMVTNGGFGGVQHALSFGVPLVVAGVTEDKPEVAARVAWSGAGVNLRRGRPSAKRVRAGVHRVLRDERYRSGAARLRGQIAAVGSPVDTISAALATVTVSRPEPTEKIPVRA
ncbi:MAG: hypothetical protein QOC59_256 [Microbacteriaceae bacterium]|nr:hypothetical protein [Microbacteriaceae bacterium]